MQSASEGRCLAILTTYTSTVIGFEENVAWWMSEVRLPGTKQASIKFPGADTFNHLFHGGITDSTGSHGATVALSPVAYAALLY